MTTMGDVARLAGVSASTVSHVLNGTRNVNASTRLRVEAAIEEVGYRRNGVARSLAAGRTHTVGLSISVRAMTVAGASARETSTSSTFTRAPAGSAMRSR